jgi:hypothetical protein
MEVPQGNSLIAILNNKNDFKNGEWEGKTCPVWGLVPVGRERR